jgi:hypothetical protein
MGKTFKDMASVMGCNNRDFAQAYWQGKGHALGEHKPKSVVHPSRRQPTVAEALRESEAMFDTMRLAWGQARK